jgi:hypothetical protein
MNQNQMRHPQTRMRRATLGTVMQLFEKFGDKGKLILGGGLAAKLALATKSGKFRGYRSKDIDLCVMEGKPFGEPEAPHEYLKLKLGLSNSWVPLEAVYSPTRYFGFRELSSEDIREIENISCITPEFYIASVLSSIPFKKKKMELVDLLLSECKPDVRRISQLLEGSRYQRLYQTDLMDPEMFFSRDFGSAGSMHNLKIKVNNALRADFPMVLSMSFGLKDLYDALMFDDLARFYITEDFDRLISHTPNTDIGNKIFMDLFKEGPFGDIMSNKITKYLWYGEFLNCDHGERDFSYRILWAFLNLINAENRLVPFTQAIHELTEPNGSVRCNSLNVFCNHVGGKLINIERIANLFNLVNKVDENFSEHETIRLGIFISGNMYYVPPFVMEAIVMNGIREGQDVFEIEKRIDYAKKQLMYGGRIVHG